MKVLTIVGARPQFIKAAVLSRNIRNTPNITEEILHTGQHFDDNMSQVFFDELEIPKPKHQLNCGSGTHGKMTARMIEGIEEVLINTKPDKLIVYGDTNSTLAGSIAASKLNIDIAHIEAGIRSFNMEMPEEINRIVTDRLSSLLFCPTKIGEENLKKEGITKGVHYVGDIMYDSYLHYAKKFSSDFAIGACLLTCHRPINTDSKESLSKIVSIANRVAEEMTVLFPLHPRVRNYLNKFNLMHKLNSKDIKLLEPISYTQMIQALKNCKLVMTDSGGLQKEALFAEKPCITLRDETEWVETVDQGANHLVGNNIEKVNQTLLTLRRSKYNIKINTNAIFGDGKSSSLIIKSILDS